MNGTEIRERRKKLGLTQVQLGEKLGIHSNTIARWEQDTLNIQHPELVSLALTALEYQAGYPVFTPNQQQVVAEIYRGLTRLEESHQEIMGTSKS